MDLERMPERVGGVTRVTDLAGPVDRPGTRDAVSAYGSATAALEAAASRVKLVRSLQRVGYLGRANVDDPDALRPVGSLLRKIMARHTVEILRPIEDVFGVLTDVTLTGRWYPAQVQEWWTTPPPHGVGSVRRARVMVMGRAMENDAVVTEHEPPRRAAMKGLSSSAPFDATFTFEPVQSGTRVVVESTFNLRGLMRLVGPLFIGRYERGWDRGLANLKRMMEAGEL